MGCFRTIELITANAALPVDMPFAHCELYPSRMSNTCLRVRRLLQSRPQSHSWAINLAMDSWDNLVELSLSESSTRFRFLLFGGLRGPTNDVLSSSCSESRSDSDVSRKLRSKKSSLSAYASFDFFLFKTGDSSSLSDMAWSKALWKRE